MRTGKDGATKRNEDPHAAMRAAQPSDAPLAIVYLAIISCALTAMIALAVAAS
jgi:hypothetical protein